MKESARYLKIVEWSDEDQCFVGECPGIVDQCCHGDDEKAVYAELCDIVDDVIELMKADGQPLPPPTAGNNLVETLFGGRAFPSAGFVAISGELEDDAKRYQENAIARAIRQVRE